MKRYRQSFERFEQPVLKNDYGTRIPNQHDPYIIDDDDDNEQGGTKRQRTGGATNVGWMKDCDRKHDIPYKCRPLLEHRDKEILNKGSNFMTIVGKSGTGKTVLLDHIVPKYKANNIIVCSLIKDNDVHQAIFEWSDENGIDCCIVHNLEDATRAVDIAKAKFHSLPPNQRHNHHTILIFDDFSKYKSGRDNPLNNFAIQAYSTLRNCGFSFIFVTQDYSNIPTLVRSNLSHIYMFPFTNYYGLLQLRLDLNSNLNPDAMTKAAAAIEAENRRFNFTDKLNKTKSEKEQQQAQQTDEDEEKSMPPNKRRRRKVNAKRRLGLKNLDKKQTSTTEGLGQPPQKKTRTNSKMHPQFETLWDGVNARINAEPFTFCLFKFPDEVYINMKKLV